MVKAYEMMSSNIATIDESNVVFDAVKKMAVKGISCVVIIDKDESPVGIITERDIIKLVIEGKDPKKIKLDKYVIHSLHTVSKDDDLSHVSKTMHDNKIRRVLVVDDGKLQGIVTQTDVVRHAHELHEKHKHIQHHMNLQTYIIAGCLIFLVAYLIYVFLAANGLV